EGVRDPAGGEGVAQRADHRLLAIEVLEAARPVLARDDRVGGGVLDWSRGSLRRRRTAEHVARVGITLWRIVVEREVFVRHGALERMGVDRTATRSETRYGCFLP